MADIRVMDSQALANPTPALELHAEQERDAELLRIVAAERQASLGFENDSDLNAQRELALNYAKGEMPDVPVMPNRSRAVSTDVADAIATVLPDLIEIFIGGDDVVTLAAVGAEDEPAARQETDYLNHVFYNENDGFGILHTAISDALTTKTGVIKYWWQSSEEVKSETFTGKSMVALQMAAQDGEVTDLVQAGQDLQTGEPLVNFTITRRQQTGRVCVSAVPPEDFAVGRDTVKLRDATYCAMRTRHRAQALVADGFDAELVSQLPALGAATDGVGQARDTAGEQDAAESTGSHDDMLRMVEIVEHVIRLPDPNGQLELWSVVTGGDESVLLRKDRVQGVGFADLTPYPVAHRFYGMSLADKLIEVQRIKTALTRMVLDSGYFALNQRHEIASEGANEYTLSDLMRNEPGMPIRSKSGKAVSPIASPGLSFDGFGALEYFSTVAEQRTGVVRNAQGLNPDTLHDTAKGALTLMTAAQKRTRLIARVFAESGLKDMFLGIHALIRENATAASRVKLRGDWVEVNPTSWAARNDMTVEVGLGSGGREHDLATVREIMAVQKEFVEFQGGADGPFVTKANLYNSATRLAERSGLKSPDAYFSDPAKAPPAAPKADPAAGELAVQQAKIQGELQLQNAKAEAQAQMEERKAQRAHELAMARIQAEMDLKRHVAEQELALKREELQAEYQLKTLIAQVGPTPTPNLQQTEFGGAPG